MLEVYEKYVDEIVDSNGNLKKIKIKPTKNFNFSYDILDEIAKQHPNDLALVWCDVDGNEKRFTFQQISVLSTKAANMFKKIGISKGDFVLIVLKRHFTFWIVLNALHKIGAIALPATHMLTIDDLKYRINFANIKTAVFINKNEVAEKILNVRKCCKSLKNLICVGNKIEGTINFLETLYNYSDKIDPVKIDVANPMLAYFTSGTTGLPKLVIHNFSYPLAHIVTAKYWQRVKPQNLHLTVSDTGWAKAVWGKFYGQWMIRSPVMVYDFDKFIADDLLNIIEKFQVKTFCAPPTIYRFFIKKGLKSHNLSSLSYVTTAGEALEISIIKEFKKITGLTIVSAFGQTETTAILIGQSVNEDKLGSIGKPSPLYNVALLDEKGNSVKPGEFGEICIKLNKENENFQIGLFNSYYNDLKLNKFVNRGGFYHTGDAAYYDEDGYFYYIGRNDDVIKSSGYRIGPFEVESVLIHHPAVFECAVIGVKDDTRGQIIKAFIVLTNMFKPSEQLAEEIKNFVKQKTAPYKYPRLVEFVKTLPKTISGKIKRNVLSN